MRIYQKLACGLLLAFTLSQAFAQPYWPTEGWRASTPEAQGMDSARLAQTVDFIVQSEPEVHSLLVIRNGYIVTEASFYPYRADIPHVLHSVTKSVTSALIGAATEQGYIRSVDQPFLSFFPNRKVANLGPKKRAMTLRHLLTMTSGLRWLERPYGSPDTTFGRMQASDDWARFLLELPMASAPGASFNYSSGDSHLLSAVLQEATGKSPLNFAQKTLFNPLGVSQVRWLADPSGIHAGGFGLSLTPRDLAKIGLLYLRGGVWNGERIMSEGWVESSTKAQVAIPIYGYQWWLSAQGVPTAKGTGGQGMMLIPELDLIVVVTAGKPFGFPLRTLLDAFTRHAVIGEGPLPENPEGYAALQAQIRRVETPVPKAVKLPAIAREVSGKVYHLGEGWFFDTLSLRFAKGEARLLLTQPEGDVEWVMPLDATYQITQNGENRFALRGYWRDEHTFVAEQRALDGAFSDKIFLTFRGEDVNVFYESPPLVLTRRVIGHLQE